MIWIIGGTCEARELAEETMKFSDKKIVITVATQEGKNQIDRINNENIEIIVGRMDSLDMMKLIENKNIEIVIDMSHPYAEEVSKNAKKATEILDCKYIRFLREETNSDKSIMFKNIEDLKNYLSIIEGTVFFTTGSKDIPEFEKVRNCNRFIYRILPADFGFKICKESGVELRDIVGIMGPFTKEFNKAMFKNYKADYVVMKNSGESGGTAEKLEASLELGIKALIIERPEDCGVSSIKEILELVK